MILKRALFFHQCWHAVNVVSHSGTHLTVWDNIVFLYSYRFKIIEAIITKCKLYLHSRLSNVSTSFYCPSFKNVFEMFLEVAFEQFVMRHTVEAIDN